MASVWKRCCVCFSMCFMLLVAAVGVAIAAVIFWPYQPFPEGRFPTPLHDLNFKPHQIEVETGVKLFVAERPGTDESLAPIVLLHGLMDSWRSFEHLWPLLTTKRRIIAFDFRGHGSSSKPHDSSYSVGLFMKDVDTLMTALNVTTIGCLVGHSLGADVAWRFAGTWPLRVERMVLIGAVPYVKPGSSFSDTISVFKVFSFMLGDSDSVPRWFAEVAVSGSVTNASDMGDEFYATCIYETLRWTPFMLTQVGNSFRDDFLPSDTEPILASIVARTTIISGEADPLTEPEQTLQLLRPQARAAGLVVPGEGHAVHWTKRGADVVAAGIVDLLSDRPVSDSAVVEQLVAHPGIHASWKASSVLPSLFVLMAVGGLMLGSRRMRPTGAKRVSASEPLLRGF